MGLAKISLIIAMTSVFALAQPATAPAPLAFDKTGAHVGDQLPNLAVYTLDGTKTQFSEMGGGHPFILITSSLTCPKSRANYPKVEQLTQILGDKLPIVVLYIIEAHPKGDVSPYRGVEDVTDANIHDGILCPQPRTLQQRLKLAAEFQKRLGIKIPIFVDGMDNALWHQLGGGPNMGYLIDDPCTILDRQGWFDADSLNKAARKFLAAQTELWKRGQSVQSPADKSLQARLQTHGINSWDFPAPFEKGDVGTVKELLGKYPELPQFTLEYQPRGNEGGRTALQFAAGAGQTEVAKLLLDHHADINARNRYFETPLYLAAQNGHRDVADLLLARDAEVDRGSEYGPTPLQGALISCHRDVADLLLKHDAKPNLFTWAAMGQADQIRQILDTDPSRALALDGQDRSPLDYAAANNQIDIANLLFSYGVDNAIEQSPWLADLSIELAIQNAHPAMLKLLLEQGADANKARSWTSHPLHLAVRAKSVEMVRLLVAHHANLKATDIGGYAPLHDAAMDGSTDVAQTLLDAGADINQGTVFDSYPCGPMRLEENEPPPNHTPLYVAAESGNVDMVKFLLAKGARTDILTGGGESVLFAAISCDDAAKRLDIVRLLLEAKVDVNLPAKSGQTPLDAAREKKDVPICILLEQKGAKSGTLKTQ